MTNTTQDLLKGFLQAVTLTKSLQRTAKHEYAIALEFAASDQKLRATAKIRESADEQGRCQLAFFTIRKVDCFIYRSAGSPSKKWQLFVDVQACIALGIVPTRLGLHAVELLGVRTDVWANQELDKFTISKMRPLLGAALKRLCDLTTSNQREYTGTETIAKYREPIFASEIRPAPPKGKLSIPECVEIVLKNKEFGRAKPLPRAAKRSLIRSRMSIPSPEKEWAVPCAEALHDFVYFDQVDSVIEVSAVFERMGAKIEASQKQRQEDRVKASLARVRNRMADKPATESTLTSSVAPLPDIDFKDRSIGLH